MFVLCIILLYCFKLHIKRSHYNYLIELSIHMIGYGFLFLCVHIQYQWFANDLKTVWLFFIYLILIASAVISIIILFKQFIFKLSMSNRILGSYLKYLRFYKLSETDPLIDGDSDKENLEEIEMDDAFSFTIFELLQNVWSIPIGFIMIECLVYSFVGDYVNLLISWNKSDKHLIKNNIIDMIFVGFIIAVATAFGQSIVELTIKRPCYQYVDKIQVGSASASASASEHCYNLNIFLLNLTNDLDLLWMQALSAGIGWSLLTPDQAKDTWKQFKIAAIGTIAFVIFGLLTEHYKMKKQNRILKQMNEIKNDDLGAMDKEKLLMDKTRKLILYDKLEVIYNGAFAVSISFAWETFASLALEDTYKGLKDVELFVVSTIYTICITLIYIRLGLELTNLKNKRRLRKMTSTSSYMKNSTPSNNA